MKSIIIILILLTSCSFKNASLYQTRYFDEQKNVWIEREKEEDGSYMPYLIGGVESLSNKIQYPPKAKEEQIEGYVYAICFVDDYGILRKVEIQDSLGYGCDGAAIQALQNSNFLPGLLNGEPVKVKVTIPIKFSLSDEKK